MLLDTDSKTDTPNTPSDFLASNKSAIKNFITKELDDPICAARSAQVLRIKRAKYYWAGQQYGGIDYSSGTGLDWVPMDFSTLTDTVEVFKNVYNIVKSDGQKFKAVVGQRRLNQVAVADDPDDPDSAKGARSATGTGRFLLDYWKFQDRTPEEIAQVIWVSGPVFGFVDYVVNGIQHGYHEEPVMGTEVVQGLGELLCGACGGQSQEGSPLCEFCGGSLAGAMSVPGPSFEQPIQKGTQSYAKGMVELYLLSGLHVTVPFLAKRIEKDCEWLDHAIVIGKYKAEALVESLTGKGDAETDESESDQLAIDAQEALEEVTNPDGEATSHTQEQRVYSRRWMTPECYEGMPRSLRKKFQKQFKKGCLIHRVSGNPVLIEEKLIAEHWSVCKSGEDAEISAPGLVETIIPLQDSINNFRNMQDETIMRGLPITLIDASLMNKNSIKQGSRIGELLPVRMAGIDLTKATRTIETAKLPERIMEVEASMRAFTREATGILERIWGGGDPAPTWRQDKQAQAGAMQQLQSPFEKEQSFVTATLTNGVRLAGRFGIGEIVNPPSRFGDVSQKIAMREIPEKGWHFESAESAPQSLSEQSTKLSGMATEAPDLANAIGLNHPINRPRVQALFGVDGMYAPGQYDIEKVQRRVEKLLSEPPIPMAPEPQIDPATGMPAVDPATGMPLPPAPPIDPATGMPMEQTSMPVDKFEDKPYGPLAEMIRVWCNSPAGEAAKNDPAKYYRNVVLHGEAQDAMAMQEAMMAAQQAPPEEGAPAPA